MTQWLNRRDGMTLVILLLAGAALAVHAQAPNDPAQLGRQLRDRFDIVALQDGIGLVPRQRDAGIRLIEVRDGAVSINGEAVTARELRSRLGRDADLVLRVTYLDGASLRGLAGATTPAAAAQPEERKTAAEAEPVRRARSRSRRGDVVRIGRDYKRLGLRNGDCAVVQRIDARSNTVLLRAADGREVQLQPRRMNQLELYQSEKRELAVGDLIRITRNDRDGRLG